MNEELKEKFYDNLFEKDVIRLGDEWQDPMGGWGPIGETSPMIGKPYRSGLPPMRRFDLAKLLAQYREMAEWINNYQRDTQVLTCVYCGHAYPPDTPTHDSLVLTEHIQQCEKHPMKKAYDERNIFRQTLVEIVGEDDPEKLTQMKSVMAFVGAPDDEVLKIGRAIDLLIKIRP